MPPGPHPAERADARAALLESRPAGDAPAWPLVAADRAPDLLVVYRLHPAPCFAYVSPSCAALTGFAAGEAMADPWFLAKIAHPDDRAAAEAAIREPRAEPAMLRIVRRDGAVRWMEQRTTLLRDPDGDVAGFVASLRDVTHLQPGRAAPASDAANAADGRRAEEALRRQTEMYESLLKAQSDLGDGVAITEGGRMVHVNPALCAMYGYTQEELLATGSFLDLVAPEERARMQGLLRRRIGGEANGSARGETTVVRRDGQRIHVEYALQPLRRGGRQTVAIIRDVTERREADRRTIQGLADAQELERLKRMDEFKTQFINTAAHELNTPLTPIRMHMHMLKTARAAGLTEAQRRSLEVLDRNVERLSRLVQDVLEAARLQAGRLGVERAPVDLADTLREAVESFEEPARQSGVALELRAPEHLPAVADAARITQVLFNLLGNALKFTPSGGRVVVEAQRGAELVTVRVQDTGPGLRAEDIAKLFQPFSQVHDPMLRPAQGTGLGLYISRGIVELHGGRIACASEGPGKGSAFTFAFPADAPPGPVPAAPG